MSKGLLSPKVDFVFKKIFGSEKHPRVLISFLNAVMKPIDPITHVQIKETDLNKDFLEDKFSRLDVKATTNKGEIINVEIQLKNEYNMIKRSLYYWSKLYEEQLNEGDSYDLLQRTVCINILNFKYLKNEKYHSAYRLKDIISNEELTDLAEIHFIEIPKLKDVDDSIDDMLMSWISFLQDPESEKVRQLEFTHAEIREAKDELCRLSRNATERELYDIREKSLKDKVSALANAEQKGIQQGIEQGILQVAKSMKDAGIPLKTIHTTTGISLEKLSAL